MKPPGSANALTAGESSTAKLHGRFGRCELRARRIPSSCTYRCSSSFSYSPISCRTCASSSRPTEISCASLMNDSSRLPVTGLVAHAVISDDRNNRKQNSHL